MYWEKIRSTISWLYSIINKYINKSLKQLVGVLNYTFPKCSKEGQLNGQMIHCMPFPKWNLLLHYKMGIIPFHLLHRLAALLDNNICEVLWTWHHSTNAKNGMNESIGDSRKTHSHFFPFKLPPLCQEKPIPCLWEFWMLNTLMELLNNEDGLLNPK